MRILFTCLLLSLVFACQNQASGDPAGSAQNTTAKQPVDSVLIVLTPFDFDTLLMEKPNIMLFDLRPPSEFAKGHLWRSTNMDATDSLFYHRMAALGVTNEFAIYDFNGAMAYEVAKKMKQYGFKRIYMMQSGLLGWGNTGRALQLD
jgi:rhodanese-related sulfurtransferase